MADPIDPIILQETVADVLRGAEVMATQWAPIIAAPTAVRAWTTTSRTWLMDQVSEWRERLARRVRVLPDRDGH